MNNRTLDTKWLGNGTEESEKGKILGLIADKSTLTDLKSIFARAKAARAQIKALEADSSISNRLSYRRERILDVIREQEKTNKVLEQTKSSKKTDGSEDNPNVSKWNEFNTTYIQKLTQYIDGSNPAATTPLGDNLYKLQRSITESYDVNESFGAERISYELCHQLAQIDTAKLTELLTNYKEDNSLSADERKKYDNTIGNDTLRYRKKTTADTSACDYTWMQKLTEYIKDVKSYDESMTERTFYGKDGKEKFKYREFAEKEMNFDVETLYGLIDLLNEDKSGDTIDFINRLGKWKNQNWFIWTAKPVSQAEKERLIKNKRVPASFRNENIKLYWNYGEGKDITINGLGDWNRLYGSIFNNSANRAKFKASQPFIELYNEMVAGLTYDKGHYDTKNKKWKESDKTNTFKNDENGFYQKYQIVVKDDYGEEIARLDAAYDLPEQTREWNQNKKELGAREKELEKSGKGTAEARAEDEHNIKVRAQGTMLENLDKEAEEKVARASIKAKQTRLNTLNSKLTAANVNWKSKSIILDALKAKKLLLDIAWIQNGGSNANNIREDKDLGITKEIDEKNRKLWAKIETEQNADSGAWNLVIREEFESKGSTDQARAEKIREEEQEEGIGLRETEAAFRSLGDKKSITIAEVIDKEFKNFAIATDSLPLSTSDLDWALGISGSTNEMVTDWGNLSNGFGKNKNKINDLVKEYNTTEAKRKGLMTFVEGLNYSEVKAAATEEEKFVAFKKRKAEEVVKDILKYENQDALSDDKTKNKTKRDEIAARMKSNLKTGWKSDDKENKFNKEFYGNPNEPEKWTSDQIIKFLYDEKIESFTERVDTWDKSSTTENAFVKHMKAHWPKWLGGGLVLAAILIAIFWKNISGWWNGPAEEGETEKNQEEDNE